MPKFMDLTGQKYGRITVKYFSGVENKKCYWVGLCDCGTITKPIRIDSLREGKTTSCGCVNKEMRKRVGKNNRKDITGKIFGYLTVIRRLNKHVGHNYVWECSCLCGKTCEVAMNHLQVGDTTSCGCRKISNLHESVKQILHSLDIEIYAEEYAIPQKYFGSLNNNVRLRIDFMVWCSKGKGLIAIECQGRQHFQSIDKFWGGEEGYKKRLENDALKKACLKSLNVPLIEVRFDETDIETFLRKELL